MKERPILLSGPMVQAILDGRKTQTRRAFSERIIKTLKCASAIGEISDIFKNGVLGKNDISYIKEYCPYGQPGDRLWVRETWWFGDVIDGVTGNQVEDVVLYKADGVKNPAVDKWHPSIHMFREYSRINLEITNTRIERLNDISFFDALEEGIYREIDSSSYMWYQNYSGKSDSMFKSSLQKSYITLWEKINGPGSWDKNPWVWVVEFRRVS